MMDFVYNGNIRIHDCSQVNQVAGYGNKYLTQKSTEA
jgi:hypothetical protein